MTNTVTAARIALGLVVALGTFVDGGLASAQDIGTTPQAAINAEGYNLRTAAGVAMLTRKTHDVIDTVCEEGHDSRLADVREIKACKAREYTKADARIRTLAEQQSRRNQPEMAERSEIVR